jgi:hypothetical protein
MLSSKFISALRNTGEPLHKVAWAAGITPGALYKITSGIDRPKRGDKRITKLCEYLGLDETDAYEDSPK